MLRSAARAKAPNDVRMLAAADRLFEEFEHLPVRTVFRAIGVARTQARERYGRATPETVEELARTQLSSRSPAVSAAG